MIALLTDFGLHGPYTGQVKAVLYDLAPGEPIVDLFAEAPAGNPKAPAYLLAAFAAWFPERTVFLCVVDPGVGGVRPALVVEADGRQYVGPGNGLFELVRRRAQKTPWRFQNRTGKMAPEHCERQPSVAIGSQFRLDNAMS
jgi:S-adenosyl-L-methionine hydrolase (adenosine-forming)